MSNETNIPLHYNNYLPGATSLYPDIAIILQRHEERLGQSYPAFVVQPFDAFNV